MYRKLLCAFAAILPGAAQAEWHEASSKHFVVYSDDTPDNVRDYTERLERFDKAIRVFRQAPEEKRGPASRVTVFVINDVDAIQRLSGRRGVAGFYNPRVSGSVAFTPRRSGGEDYGMTPQAILFHEYAHHWMLTTWSDAALPPWFVEGFAEFHATAKFKADGSVTFGAAPMYRQYTGMQMNILPASQLMRRDPGKLATGEERDALYSRGWLLTHYLTFDPDRRKQLADYIVAINSGKPIDEAMRIIGDPGSLDMKLNSYARRASLPSVTMSKAELPISPVVVRKLTPGEAATMPARLVSTRGVDDKAAPAAADLARRLAAPFPDDAGAQNVLAEAEYDAATFAKGDTKLALYAAAEAAADRAIAADPRSIHALVYKAKARLSTLAEKKATDPAAWTAARGPLLAANKIDPEDPYPLFEFYQSFEEAKQPPSKGAESALIYAYALAPYDPGVRFTAAKLFLQQDKVDLARTAIAPVAYSRDTGPTNSAQKVLAALEKDGASAALKILDEVRKGDDEDGEKGKDKDKKD